MRAALILLLWLFPALAGAEEAITTPHLDQTSGARAVTFAGQAYVNQGLVGAGVLPAGTLDFLGDTLGSFSSLQLQPGSWKRVGDRYEGVLWTLPDRGRNDPAAGLFFDYPARLVRLRVSFAPATGKLTLVPDGGMELRDFAGRPFTGADPGAGTLVQRGLTLPAPASGLGAGKISLDAEALQFTANGGFYVGDEYTAGVYYFDKHGRLAGVITPPPAVTPRQDGQPAFGSLQPPQTGRRNNQGAEGVSLSPDGRTLFVALQSALIQDSAPGSVKGDAAGRTATRILAYDVSRDPAPAKPAAHYVIQLPAYTAKGDGGPPDRTAAQSEIRALSNHSFLMLARDGAGLGASNPSPIVYKSILLVDVAGATNLAGTEDETSPKSLLAGPAAGALLAPGVVPAQSTELINMLNPGELARVGLTVPTLSEKWEAMDLAPVLEPGRPADVFLFVGNDNDFIARSCQMSGQSCDSAIDNDNRILVYRLTLPAPLHEPLH